MRFLKNDKANDEQHHIGTQKRENQTSYLNFEEPNEVGRTSKLPVDSNKLDISTGNVEKNRGASFIQSV